MKRLILLSLAFVAAMLSWAVTIPSDFRIVCKDGSVAYFCGRGTELTFNEEGTVLYIQTEGQDAVVSYAIDGIEAVEFAQSGKTYDAYDYAGDHIDVAFSSSDDTSFTEVKENVITDESHDDYGDFIENYKPKNTVVITYKEGKATYMGKPSSVEIEISGAHVIVDSDKSDIAFTLKGSTTNGSFKLYSEKKAQITLDGVSITNPTGAAINIQSGKTMMIKLADGAANYLEDGKSYTLEGTEQQKGTFFSEGQLVFSGNGSLNVKSNYGHGIVSDDYVRVRGGNITINSVRDGINTSDRFIMYDGVVNITAQQDGIDVDEGYIEIGGGQLTVNAVDEGITASYEGDENSGIVDPLITPYIDIKGGLIKVVTTGDKGHGVRAMSTFSMSGGIVQATTKGAGSKALMSEGGMSLIGGKVTALTEGSALYEDSDLSSSAGIRSKGVLTMKNITLGIKSTGTGSKGINNVGDVVVENCRATIIASGATHKSNGLDSRSRGVDTDGNLTLNGGVMLVKSYDEPLHLKGKLSFLNNAVYNGYQIEE